MAEPEKRSSDAGERPPMAPRQWPAWLGIGLAWLAARIPWRLQRPLGRAIGSLLYRLLRDRRHVARRNIALCFPELDASRQEALARANFGELGIGLFEFARAWWGSVAPMRGGVRVEGLEHLKAAQAGGRGRARGAGGGARALVTRAARTTIGPCRPPTCSTCTASAPRRNRPRPA